jgi:tetratricopeptide (TPR) repeat protein
MGLIPDPATQGEKGGGVVKGTVRELEKRLLQAAGDRERLEALLALGGLHADEGRDRDGLRAAREALDLARAAGLSLAVAQALALASRCHHHRGDHLAAMASGVDALVAFGHDEVAGRADALRVIALALLAVEDFDRAEAAAERAVRTAAGNEALEAGARATYGQVLAERGRSHAARHELRRAGALYRRMADRLALKRISAAVAGTYRFQAAMAQRAKLTEQSRLQWRHAARVYRTALAFARHARDDVVILAGLGECALELGDIEGAHQHAVAAIALGGDEAAARALGPARLVEARALRALDRPEAAERACAHGVAAAEATQDLRLLAACLRVQARVSDQLGRFQAGADLDERARRTEHQRGALLARTRAEMAPLWERVQRDSPTIVPLNSRA